jgi:RNA polymerase sigma-70 factor (ECF subfamily)
VGDRRRASAAVLAGIEADAADDLATPALVARVRAGDDLAFAEIYVRYERRVNRYLTIALKNFDDAQEATQEIFVRVLQHFDQYEQRSEPFASWLFRIVRNYALDLQKRRWRTEATDPHVLAERDSQRRDHAAPDPEDRPSDIGALIDDLPKSQRHVLVLIYVYDFSVADVAEALGKTCDGVRHIHMRALRAIGAHLPAAQVSQPLGNGSV